jgi:hypothetical protein
MSLALARVNLLFLVLHQLPFGAGRAFAGLPGFPGAASGVGGTTATIPLRISIVPLRFITRFESNMASHLDLDTLN